MKKFVIKFFFKPSLVGLVVNPFFIARSYLYTNIKKIAPLFKGNLLDIGCGDKPYEELFNNVITYEGIEISNSVHETTKADFFYDGKVLPFHNSTYDSIILNEVLEHVFNPDELLGEIHRVLKSEGKLMITIPFVWDEHEQPYDFARYSSFGITYLLEQNHFKVQRLVKSCPSIAVVFQLLTGYIYKVTFKLPLPFRVFFIILLCFPLNSVGLFLGIVLPKNRDLYLDTIIVATKA